MPRPSETTTPPGERAKRASLDEDENTRVEVRETTKDIINGFIQYLANPPNSFGSLHFTRLARPSLKISLASLGAGSADSPKSFSTTR